MSTTLYENYNESGDISITRFYGGRKRGVMIQVTINQGYGYYVRLNKDEAIEMANKIKEGLNNEDLSVADDGKE
jgi:hypothetical protein